MEESSSDKEVHDIWSLNQIEKVVLNLLKSKKKIDKQLINLYRVQKAHESKISLGLSGKQAGNELVEDEFEITEFDNNSRSVSETRLQTDIQDTVKKHKIAQPMKAQLLTATMHS